MRTDYERQLLERLLAKYEKSKAYTAGRSSRRIALSVSEEEWLQGGLEEPEEKRLFLAVLAELKEQGIIDYSWVKYEEGNLADKVWLLQDEEGIEKAYRRLGRIPAKEKAEGLLALLEAYAAKLEPGAPLSDFLDACMDETRDRKKRPSYFTEDAALNEDILKGLVYMENNRQERMERFMSMSLYGDSKRFEKEVKPKVLSILRAVKRAVGEEVLEDEELLKEKGIVRWPEIMEFTGRLRIRLEDGSRIDYSAETYGAYINSSTVSHIAAVEAEGIKRVLFIENKANYVWYISRRPDGGELTLLHGGCYSPVKGQWFRRILEGLERQAEKPEYYHWSDIDVGGFHIFQRLRSQMIPNLQPYRMDLPSLEQYRKAAGKITSPSYLKTLERLGKDPEYSCFHEVIGKMLEERIRLEQEAMIAFEA